MATHDYDLANAAGITFRGDLNNVLAAIISQNSNPTEPTTTVAYMFWADTTTAILKQRNSLNTGWNSLFNMTTMQWLASTANVTVVDAAADTTTWPMLATSQTGDQAPTTDAGLTYDATTNVLTVGGLQGIRRKALTFTRLSSAASGNVSYTGSGFLPRKGTLMIGLTSGQVYWSSFSFSIDSSVGLQANGITVGAIAVTGQSGANPVIGNYFEGSTSNYVQANLSSFDADGITITWTKVGSPVGTFTCWLLLEE